MWKTSDVLQYLHSLNKDVFIVGDFNINVAEAMLTTDSTVSDFYNMFYSLINKLTIAKLKHLPWIIFKKIFLAFFLL